MAAQQVQHRALGLRVAQQQHVLLAILGRRKGIDTRLAVEEGHLCHDVAAYRVQRHRCGQRLGHDASGDRFVHRHLRHLAQQRQHLGNQLFAL